jgi:hypothetical protein
MADSSDGYLATTERRSRAAVLVAQAAVTTDDPVLVVDAMPST